MDTRPISAVLAIAAYQLPLPRRAPLVPLAPPPPLPPFPSDTVEISAEGRLAAQEHMHLWGEVRYDAPHYDDPDLPWEAAHQDWMDLIDRVFGGPAESAESPGDQPAKRDAADS